MDAAPTGPSLEPGTLLIAGAGLSDGVFDEAVVLLLDGDEAGALGVVVNRFADMELAQALPGWDDVVSIPHRLHNGGPVAQEGAICLASPLLDSDEPPGWRRLFSTIGLLHLQTPLELVEGAYRDVRIFAGYAGWGPGQLEGELAGDLWYPVRGTYSDVFDADPESLWRRILRRQPGELGWLATWTSTPELN